MRRATRFAILLLVATLAAQAGVVAKKSKSKPASVAQSVEGMETLEGLLRLHLDRSGGKVWLEVDPPGENGLVTELIYVEGLTTGLGSNPVGLDRGQLGDSRWVALRRLGPRVLIEQLNAGYRALSDDPDERRATRESFATSILWAADAAVVDPDGRALVDFTSFLLRDAHAVERTLERTGQGSFRLDVGRSVVDLDRCLAFPDNVELEALLTYAGTNPGAHVQSTAPFAEAVTFVHHTSFVRLPDDRYRPRAFDPRAGSFAVEFHDYAAGLTEPYLRRWIVRHRLEKLEPEMARSRARKPIVYYVDRGVPEPVRSALVDGARWWAEAFEAAGFIEAFQVHLLPEGVHPLDVRYNVIEWVHRSTRGWSYGGGVYDPRTGERIKGHINLGSLRVRQDRLLFEGLAGTGNTGSGAPDDPVELALARIRQLSAHEVGHALGFAHNFAASTYAGRASVMDYPAPLVTINAMGELDFSKAYGVGIGAWDKHAARFAYSQFPSGAKEAIELDKIVREGLEAGYVFLSDADARSPACSDARASLWDNGSDPLEALELTLAVRRHALDRFGERNVAVGTPLAHLEEVLATVYFHHRFQMEAALKVVGGMEYEYALRGDGQRPTRIVDGERQRRAIDALLAILQPAALDLPDALVETLAPRPFGDAPNREMFETQTWPAFDLQGAAEAAARALLDGLLHPERLARMAELHRRDETLPGADELLERLHASLFEGGGEEPARAAELRRTVESVAVQRLIALATDESIRPAVRSRVEAALERIGDRDAPEGEAHQAFLRRWIGREIDRPAAPAGERWEPPAMPPGSPIGN